MSKNKNSVVIYSPLSHMVCFYFLLFLFILELYSPWSLYTFTEWEKSSMNTVRNISFCVPPNKERFGMTKGNFNFLVNYSLKSTKWMKTNLRTQKVTSIFLCHFVSINVFRSLCYLGYMFAQQLKTEMFFFCIFEKFCIQTTLSIWSPFTRVRENN